LVLLIGIFAAPQALAQDDDPVPWPCYKPTVERSENPRPCDSLAQDDGAISQLNTAFFQEKVTVLRLDLASSQSNSPVRRFHKIIAGEIRNRDALLNKSQFLEFALFRS
jgi:hypothetical protein